MATTSGGSNPAGRGWVWRFFDWIWASGDKKSHKLPGSALGKTLGGGVIVGAIILVPFAIEIHPSWSIFAAAAMFAVTSMAGGGLLGLLFGVPRSVVNSGQSTGNSTDGAPLAGIAANTNLEQISDWLTKIIVGVSLTQLFTIKRSALRLFNAMAPALEDAKAADLSKAAAFAGAEVVYFSILGFLVCWTYARLRLGLLMGNTDILLSLAQRAESAGDPMTAQVARGAAAASLRAATMPAPAAPETLGSVVQQSASPVELAARYVQLRATLPANPARTAQLEDVVRQARQLGRTRGYTRQDTRSMFQTGDEGSRVVALGLMQGDISSADLDSVLDALSNARSSFEQYHALTVADLLAPTLNTADQLRLRDSLRTERVRDYIGVGTRRRAIADHVLAQLPP